MNKKRQFYENFKRASFVKEPSNRAFGLTIGFLTGIISLGPLLEGNAPWKAGLLISITLVGLAFIQPQLLNPLNRLWMRFGRLLGRLINPIILAIMYYLIVTPIGLLMRLFGKNSISVKFDSSKSSYWIKRPVSDQQDIDSMRHPF